MEKSSKRKISHLKRVSAVDVPNYGSPTEHSPPYKVCQICRHIRVTTHHICRHIRVTIRVTYASHMHHIPVTYASHTCHIHCISHMYLIHISYVCPQSHLWDCREKNVAYSLSTNVITLLWPHWPLSNSKAIDPKFSKEYSLLPHLV